MKLKKKWTKISWIQRCQDEGEKTLTWKFIKEEGSIYLETLDYTKAKHYITPPTFCASLKVDMDTPTVIKQTTSKSDNKMHETFRWNLGAIIFLIFIFSTLLSFPVYKRQKEIRKKKSLEWLLTASWYNRNYHRKSQRKWKS